MRFTWRQRLNSLTMEECQMKSEGNVQKQSQRAVDKLYSSALIINRHDEERKQTEAIADLFQMRLYDWQK